MLTQSDEDWQALCERFGADEELLREYELRPEVVQATGGALYVRGRRRAVYVKRVVCSSTRLMRIYRLVERLSQSGVKVARFVCTKYGDPFVARPDGLFYATAALPGGQPRLERIEVLIQGVQLLASWHDSATTEPGELLAIERLDVPARLMQDLARLEACRERALHGSASGPVDEFFLSIREELCHMVQMVLVGLRACDFPSLCRTAWLTGAVCHGSFVKQNLLSHEGQLTALDHDHVYLGPQVLDVAAYLRRYARLYDWSPDILAHALASYERVRPLSTAEYGALPALLSYPESVLRILEWYYEGRYQAPEEEFLDALEREWVWQEACRTALDRLYGGVRDSGSEPQPSMAAAQAILSPSALAPEEAVQEEQVPGLTRFWQSWRKLTSR